MAQATIVLELFRSGIHLTCEDTGHDEFIPHGDGNKLIDLINEIEIETDPNTTYSLTAKGKHIAHLMDDEGMSFEDAVEKAEEDYQGKDPNLPLIEQNN